MAIRHENKVELVGKVFNDPEVKTMQSGSKLVTFKLVTDENKRNKQTGEWERESEFHNITVWNQNAIEDIINTVRKYYIVRLKGKIKTRKWQDREGNDRYTTGIVVDNFGEFEFLEEAKEVKKGNAAARKPVYTNNRPQDDEDSIPF